MEDMEDVIAFRVSQDLASNFNNDVQLLWRKGGRIQKMNKQLQQLSNVEQHIKQSFNNEFISLKNAHRAFTNHIDEIGNTTDGVMEQIRLLVPELVDVTTQADNLLADFENCLQGTQAQGNQAQTASSQPSQPQAQAVSSQASQPQVQGNQIQAVSSQPSQPEAPVSELATSINQINNFSTPVLQITVPLKFNSIRKLESQTPLINNFISNTHFELQLKCLKSQNNQNQIFFGINMNINPNFSNLTNGASKKSTFVSLRSVNNSVSFSRHTVNNDSYITFYVGRIVRFKTNEVTISTNFGSKNRTLKKESFHFQIELKPAVSFLPTIGPKSKFYCKPELTLSYDFFPFANSILKTTQLNKKQNRSVQSLVSQNSDVIFNLQTEPVAKIQPEMGVDATDVIKQSNLLKPESHILVSTPSQPLTLQPSFFQKYGTVLLFSLGIIGVVISGYIKKKKKD